MNMGVINLIVRAHDARDDLRPADILVEIR